MNITVEDIAPCKKRLKIEVPANRVQQAFDKVADDFQREARIPGFRPGHAPRAVVVKKYQKDIESETQRVLVPQAYQEAVQEKKLRVVSSPEIEDLKYQPGLSLSFSTLVELVPDFHLPSYKGIPVKKREVSVTDADVDQTLQSLADQRAQFEDAPERPLEMGDFAVISYAGKHEGKPLSEILPAENKTLAENAQFWLWMRPEAFIPGFAEKCVGLNKNETRTVTVEIPADFPQTDVAGKTVDYEVTLKDIKIKKAPVIDDAFAQELAQLNLDELKVRIKENLERERKAEADRDTRNELAQKLLAMVEFELPPSSVEQETQSMVYDIVMENQARGISDKLLEEKKDEIFNNASRSARESVKFKFIALQIADNEKIEVTDQQVIEHLAFLAQREGITLEKMIERVRKNDAIGLVRLNLLRQAVMDFLLKEARFE